MTALTAPQFRQTADGQLWYRSTGDLTDRWVQTPNPIWERQRIYYGREISPEIIESAIISADHGFLRELTDLIAEQTRMDPHWSMCDRKRLRAVNGAKIEVVPASGDDIDVERAALYAGIVRKQILGIGNLKKALVQLNWAHKHGRGAQEKIWAEQRATLGSDSVKFRIDSVNWIHARRLAFGPERELRVRDDIFGGGLGFAARGLDLRDYPFKFIAFLPQQYDEYPEREGYGVRGLFWSYFKRFGNREQLILLEQFGRPWRHLEEIDPTNGKVQADTLKNGAEELDKAAANATGYAPPGTKIVTEQPQQGAGQVHKDVKEDANDELSKLILGEVRTSDAKPTALGGAGDKIADEVQDEVKIEDAEDLSDVLTDHLARDIIELNFDAGELDHAPRVRVYYESPPDRSIEIDRTTKAFSLGIPLKEDEVYERIGFTKPTAGDAVIKQAPQPAGPFGAPAQPGASESTTPGADAPGDGVEPAARALNSAAPLSFETLARAAHVLELTRYLGGGTQVVRSVVPPKPAGK